MVFQARAPCDRDAAASVLKLDTGPPRRDGGVGPLPDTEAQLEARDLWSGVGAPGAIDESPQQLGDRKPRPVSLDVQQAVLLVGEGDLKAVRHVM